MSDSVHTPRRERRPSPERVIVVVDDDDDVRGVVVALFQKLGLKALEAQNGRAALDLIALHPSLDLLVTDLQMPVMDGTQLVEEVLKVHPDAKIVCMTATSWQPPREDIAILRKPFRTQELIDLGLKLLRVHA